MLTIINQLVSAKLLSECDFFPLIPACRLATPNTIYRLLVAYSENLFNASQKQSYVTHPLLNWVGRNSWLRACHD